MPTERKDSIIVGLGAWRWLQGRLRTLEAARAACADEALRLTRRNAELRRAVASLAEKARSAEHRLYREQKAWEEAGRRSEDEIAIQRAVASEIGRKYVEEVRKHEVTKCERDALGTELRNERKVRCWLAAEVQELRRKVSQSVTGPSQEEREVADEYAMEENPEWMDERVAHHRATGEFEALAVVPVSVPHDAVMARLRPEAQAPVPGTVEG